MTADFRFRIFRRGDEKKAFRLENVFWNLLQDAANVKEQKLRDFVFSIVESDEAASNQSSSLRVAAAKWASERLSAYEKPDSLNTTGSMFQACPSPGLIITEDRRIVSYNQAMISFMQSKLSTADKSKIAGARFAFEIPISHVMNFFADMPEKFMECGYRLVFGDDVLKGRVRVFLYGKAIAPHRHLGVFIIA